MCPYVHNFVIVGPVPIKKNFRSYLGNFGQNGHGQPTQKLDLKGGGGGGGGSGL